ncbi:MAG TPA: hypothetical protein VMU84_17400, partial [Thermoanaerobaculia bacterium]|nr:hypothetical protein [Thermoanaerobaculia bacterium]
ARAAGLRFAIVPRLTAIKFPAAWRRDVYRDRPCHEQAAWLERIRAEGDLETKLLIDIAFDLWKPPSLGARVVRLLLQPWRWPAVIWRRVTSSKGRTIRKRLRFKGVSDHA